MYNGLLITLTVHIWIINAYNRWLAKTRFNPYASFLQRWSYESAPSIHCDIQSIRYPSIRHHLCTRFAICSFTCIPGMTHSIRDKDLSSAQNRDIEFEQFKYELDILATTCSSCVWPYSFIGPVWKTWINIRQWVSLICIMFDLPALGSAARNGFM